MIKKLYKSKTVIGALLTALTVFLPMFGLSFTADDSAMISTLVDQIILAATTALTLYGRFDAQRKIDAGSK